VFTRLAVVPMTAAQLTQARAGDHVAVIGLGPIGNLTAQVFQLCGCEVNAFELSPTRRAVASRCGVNSAHHSDAILSFGSIHRAVIEATGSANVLPLCLDLVCDRGEIVMIGAPWGKGSEGFPINNFAGALFSRFVTLRSGWESELPLMGTNLAFRSVEQNCATVQRWLAQGKLVSDPLITHRLRPNQIMVGYEGLEKKREEFITRKGYAASAFICTIRASWRACSLVARIHSSKHVARWMCRSSFFVRVARIVTQSSRSPNALAMCVSS